MSYIVGPKAVERVNNYKMGPVNTYFWYQFYSSSDQARLPSKYMLSTFTCRFRSFLTKDDQTDCPVPKAEIIKQTPAALGNLGTPIKRFFFLRKCMDEQTYITIRYQNLHLSATCDKCLKTDKIINIYCLLLDTSLHVCNKKSDVRSNSI